MYFDAVRAIAGSSFTRSTSGQLRLRNQQGDVIYEGKADRDAVLAALEDEHEMIGYAVNNWLTNAGVFGDGWHFIPLNAPQTAPHIKKAKSSLRV